MHVILDFNQITLSSKLPNEVAVLEQLELDNDGVTISKSNQGHTQATFWIANSENEPSPLLPEAPQQAIENMIVPPIPTASGHSGIPLPGNKRDNAAPTKNFIQRLFTTKDSTPGTRNE